MTKEEKNELIEFLRKQLLEKIKLYALVDMEDRAALSLGIAKPKNVEIQDLQLKTSGQKRAIQKQIGHLKLIIEEVEKGSYEVIS